jgi:outer membrane protein
VIRLFAGAVALLAMCSSTALSQLAPPSPSAAWAPPDTEKYKQAMPGIPLPRSPIDSQRVYTVAELIDIAESTNPETRIAWEQAKQQAAALGITKSQLYPQLAALAAVGQRRSLIGAVPAPDEHINRTVSSIQPGLAFTYLILDFGGRSSQIEAAKATLFAANSTFNRQHQETAFQVAAGYFNLLGWAGQVQAAQANLENAQTVQQYIEERLKNGFATLPDVLQARSESAQTVFDLERVRGAEQIAQVHLSEKVGILPTSTIRIAEISASPTPSALADSAESFVDRALAQRPDLLAEVAAIRAAEARVRTAGAAFYPTLSVSAVANQQFTREQYNTQPTSLFNAPNWLASLTLQWTVLDGGARQSRYELAKSQQREAEQQFAKDRNQAASEVLTAYTNLRTALRQQEAATALLTASEKSYDAAFEAYRAGVKSLLDVVSSQRFLAQARTANVVARVEVLTQTVNLAFSAGDSVKTSLSPGKP